MSVGAKTTAAGARLLGVDAARGVALLGMMSVHVIPALTQDGEFSASRLIAGGRSSALFAVLAGVSLALVAGGRTPPAGRELLAARLGVGARALVIFLVGMMLGSFDSGVAVILAYYGVLFLLAVPFLGLGPRMLLPLAAAWAVLAPLVSHAWRMDQPAASYDNPTLGSLAAPATLIRELLFTGYYPVFPWMAYALAGMGLGRLALNSPRVAGALFGGGAALAAATWATSWIILDSGVRERLAEAGLGGHPASPGDFADVVLTTSFYGTTPTTSWWWLVVSSPHTATPFDLLHTIGTAAAVLGLMLLLAPRAAVVLRPLGAVGSMTFTLYSLHVVLLTTVLPPTTTHAYALHIVVAFAIAVPWRRFVGRGPLEALAATMSRNARALAGPPH